MRSPRSAVSLFAAVLAAASALGCSAGDADDVALATQCMRASEDNRAKLSASWLSNAEIDVSGDLVTVRTEVPVGIGIDATVKFRRWVYRCRRHGERMEFLGYERTG